MKVYVMPEGATGAALWKDVFLKISHWCFSVNFVKFLRTSFLQNTSGQLLLLSRLSNVKKRLEN